MFFLCIHHELLITLSHSSFEVHAEGQESRSDAHSAGDLDCTEKSKSLRRMSSRGSFWSAGIGFNRAVIDPNRYNLGEGLGFLSRTKRSIMTCVDRL